jgi:acid phosphatase family membrane protein YuiD
VEYIKDFFTNYVLMSAVVGWFCAQVIKVIMALFDKVRPPLSKVLFSTGGMPSSHSSAVCALCIASGIGEGLGSPIFAVTLVLAGVVMIDASGVRYETGKQAKIINRITKELFSGKPDEINMGLKELVGHTPFQVFMGALLGIVVAVAMAFLMGVLG